MTRTQGTEHSTEIPGPSAAKIIAVYETADPNMISAGHAWYDAAHALAVELDPANPRRAAGVLAALSPRTPWKRNVVMARAAYATGTATGGLGTSCRAANRILAGEDPLDVLRAAKVRAFFTLIADPTDRHTVCVDRHATDVAIGERMDDETRAARYRLDVRGWYGRFADAYRLAAHVLGATPAQVQATTWLAWRKVNLDVRHQYLAA